MSLAMIAETPSTALAPRPRRFKGSCLECGREFRAARRDAEFCGNTCRRAWNNRRLVRGAEILDLFMALRNDRERATLLGVWKIMCRLAKFYREQDVAQRDGRRSWQRPDAILEKNPWLRVDVIAKAHLSGKRRRP